MASDLKEDKMINEYIEEMKARKEGLSIHKSKSMSQKEIDEDFDNLDINSFNTHLENVE